MNQEKVTKLLSDPEFVKEFLKADTEEQASELFASHGCSVELEDIKLIARSAALVIKKEGKVSDEDVSAVAGGFWMTPVEQIRTSNREKLDAGAILGAIAGALSLGIAGAAVGYGAGQNNWGWAAGAAAAGVGTLGGAAGGAAIGRLIGKILKHDPKEEKE